MSSRSLEPAPSAADAYWRDLAARSFWHVPTAARQLGLSLRQLERLCQRDLGCSPRDYFQRDRMAAAARRLAAGQPVKAVAMSLGYTRPANFSRDFKRHFARNPRTFTPRLFSAAGVAWLPQRCTGLPPSLGQTEGRTLRVHQEVAALPSGYAAERAKQGKP